MLGEPSTRLGTVVAGEVVRDDGNVSNGIVGFNALKQCAVVGRVARSSALRQFLPIMYTQGSIDPGFLRSANCLSNGALMRCPEASQGQEGSCAGLTSPSSSVQTGVSPSGGWV